MRGSTSRSPACSPKAWSATRPTGHTTAPWGDPSRGHDRITKPKRPGARALIETGAPVALGAFRKMMSKSAANTVDPEYIIETYGRRHRTPVHAVGLPARARPRMDRRRRRGLVDSFNRLWRLICRGRRKLRKRRTGRAPLRFWGRGASVAQGRPWRARQGVGRDREAAFQRLRRAYL